MHICDLTTLYIDGGEGGVNTYLTEKARYFAEHDGTHRHTIIVPGARNSVRALFKSTLYTLRSPRFCYNPHHRVLLGFPQVKQVLLHVKPDVVEVDCAYILGHWVRAALGKWQAPLVGFYHSHLPSFYARPLTQRFGNGVSHLAESIAWRYVTYCLKPLDKVLVASNDIYERLLARTDKKVEQVTLGVNLDLFTPHPTLPQARHGRRPVILYVGRLSQEKDLPILFEAFRLLNQAGAYQLRIVGDGPLRAYAERFVRSTPHVTYTGLIPYGKQLAEVYTGADILALPSRNETFGLAILEALASGIPVVAVNRGGPSNLLHAHIGALAMPGDPVDFAAKVASVLAHKPVMQQCRTFVEHHFAWEKTFTKLLDIYTNLRQASGHQAARPS
jgi:alpha-1,6-mannosyltransferase